MVSLNTGQWSLMLSDVMLNYILTGLSPSLPPYLGNPSFSCPLFSSSLKLLTVCMKTRKMSFVFIPHFFSWRWGRNAQNSLQWPCGISATRRTSGMALWWQWKNGPEKQTNKQNKTKQAKTINLQLYILMYMLKAILWKLSICYCFEGCAILNYWPLHCITTFLNIFSHWYVPELDFQPVLGSRCDHHPSVEWGTLGH